MMLIIWLGKYFAPMMLSPMFWFMVFLVFFPHGIGVGFLFSNVCHVKKHSKVTKPMKNLNMA